MPPEWKYGLPNEAVASRNRRTVGGIPFLRERRANRTI